MSIVKAKCLKCNQIIEVDNTEDAGICPNCGSAYVTEKVIKNLNVGATAKQPKSRTYIALADLADKYNAFVSLYNINFESLLEVYKYRKSIRDKEALVNQYVDEYNSSVKAEQKMVNKYNNRVKGFNDAKYTAGADSLQERLHRKYVESAVKKRDYVQDDIKNAKKKAEAEHDELESMISSEKNFSQSVFKENLNYNYLAKAVAEKMCNDYPSNPLGYLYLADWYKREAEWQRAFYEYARVKYEEDSVVVTEFMRDFDFENSDRCAQTELQKADHFMTDKFDVEYADLVEQLTGVEKPKKSSAKSSTRATSNTAKNLNQTASKSSATKSTTSKSGASAKPKTESSSTTKSTASTTPKFKSGSEKDNRKKIERKARARVRAFNFIFKLLMLGILAGAVVCVCKFVFHLF